MSAATGASEMHDVIAARTAKLLLVDDDPDNLLALQAVVEPLNQQVMLARNGTDALRLCLDHDFAAILLDVRMPGMDGFETAELIRARKRSRHTPILFLTAYRSDEQLFRGYDLGAVDYLFKPIIPEVLQGKVRVFVELQRSEELLRQQAAELARTERKFRAVLEAAPDAMFITNESGVIELANSRADELFGYSRVGLIGTNIRNLIPKWEAPAPGGPGVREPRPEVRYHAVRENGSTFPAGITLSPFHTPEAKFVTTAARDATGQVATEARIQKINIELEKRVQERTVELTRSNEALQQFAWAASHDLQEPVRTVLAYSQWLSQSIGATLGPRESQMLQFVEEHAKHMHQLLGALQAYIQVAESGLQQRTWVDCNAAAKTAQSALQGLIHETGAVVVCKDLPTVLSIEVLIVQLFQNLISNAIKYRSDEPPKIEISAEASGDNWVVSVKDNGMGIDSKYFDYIFGVFRRLDGAKHSGTGMGLAICRAAAERLGGRIWVESQVGTGSVFHFLLPKGGTE